MNVIGVLKGEDRSMPALLLMAHHDTVWGSPGAADATIGLTSILEIARAAQEGGPLRRDLIVLFTDAEELGLDGARQFFSDNPLKNHVGAIINFEARGGGGVASMFQTSADNGAAARLYANTVRHPSTSSLSTFVYSELPNDTDLTAALDGDYIAYNIANIGAAKYYHSPKITADNLDERSLQHMGSMGLDLTRALLSVESFPVKTTDATFFDLYGFFTLLFATFWGWAFIVVGGLSFGLSVSHAVYIKEIISGAGKMLGFIVLGGAAVYGLNWLSGSGGNYYDRLAAIPKLEVMTAVLCLAMFLLVFGQKALTHNARVGAALPILALGVIVQFYAPTASYFLTLPILLYGLILLAQSRLGSAGITTALAVIFGAAVIGYMIGIGHLLMLGVGPDLPSLAIVIAAIGVLFIGPLYEGLSKRVVFSAAALMLVLSIAVSLWIKLDPIASTIPPY